MYTGKISLRIMACLTAMMLLIAACSRKGTATGGNPVTPTPTPSWDKNAVRGVWLTNVASTALDSRENIRDAVLTCKRAGINNIFMVVYNNARTMYPSQVMQQLIGIPISERFSGRDPLQELLDEAGKEDIKVHAWFEYGFASSYSAGGGPILAAKPGWAARDANGSLTIKNGFEWLNAFHPEVQDFLMSLMKEVVNKYPALTGIQGDDRLPALPSSAGYDDYTVSLYKAEHGGNHPPASFQDGAWVDWRARKLNAFMKRIHTEIKALRPGIQITMSPSVFPWSKAEYLQDWPTWVDSGWVDAVIPQVYRYDLSAYTATLAQQKAHYRNPSVKFYPGVLLRVGTYTAPDNFLSQMIQLNRQQGFTGEVYFFYEGLKERSNWFHTVYPYIK